MLNSIKDNYAANIPIKKGYYVAKTGIFPAEIPKQ